MSDERRRARQVALVVPPEAGDSEARSLAAVLGSLGHRVTVVAFEEDDRYESGASGVDEVLCVPRLDVEVFPRYLESSYRIHRSLVGCTFDAIVFPDRGSHAYCSGRARQLGLGYPMTRVVVHCAGTTLRAVSEEGRSFVAKGEVGTMAAERLSVRIADAVVCDGESTFEWMRDQGWALPEDTVVLGDDSPALRAWAEVLERPALRARPAAAGSLPPVSVVVTHYERPELLRACLAALTAQTVQPAEVLVADDGSPGSLAREVLSSVEAASWPWRLEVLRLPHGGVHEARNAGWRAAARELVLFVDDDDVPFPSSWSTSWARVARLEPT